MRAWPIISARTRIYICSNPVLRGFRHPLLLLLSLCGEQLIGGDRRYDTATFHTRLDGLDTSGRLRRTMHQYYARGAWTADGRGPATPLTDWNVFPERLANSADVCGMIMAP